MIDRADITGVVLAGGRGSRMGGVDKGLQVHEGIPLAQHALQRLAPQVGPLMFNANRNLDAYAALGAPAWPDALPDFAGPLAGFLAGLEHCTTRWLVTVPCDSPNFPADLVQRLAAAVEADDAELAMACTLVGGATQPQPVFCLMRMTLRGSLERFTGEGGRKIDRWTALHRCADVVFADASAFANANTRDELQALRATTADD